MSIGSRLSLAWRAITGAKSAVTTFSEVGWQRYQDYSPVNFETMVTQGYRRNELIFACINKRANASSQISLRVSTTDDGEPDDRHPLKRLIQKPNPYMSEFDFWSAIVIYQSLAGRAVFEKERGNGGRPVRLWPLRPDWVKPVREGALIASYEYEPPGLERVIIPASDIVDFQLFDPLGQFSAWPPAAVAARIGDSDNAATDHIRGIWQHGGVPAGLIKTVQRLIPAQVDAIQRQWLDRYGGGDNWHKPMVFDADAEYQKIGFSFAELGFDVLDARSEARICQVFDIPPILVGAKIGLDRATYSNYKEARLAWWQDSLMPMYTSYLDVIQNQLASEFGDPSVSWDYNAVPALQEDANLRWTRSITALQAGGITVNEFRGEVGLPDTGAAGDIYLRGLSVVEVPAKTGRRVEQPEGDQEPEDTDDTEGAQEPDDQEQQPGGKSVKAASSGAPDDIIRKRYERALRGDMIEFFSGQLTRIRRALAKKGLSDIAAAFWEHEDSLLWKVLLRSILAATIAAAGDALDDVVGANVDWTLINTAARAWANTYSYDLVKEINGTTRRFLTTEVSNWIDTGEPLGTLIDALTPSFGPVRAEMIAVTEVTRSFAEGNAIAWGQSGLVARVTWMTTEDELVCPICGEYNGHDYPLGDEEHRPPAHVNCRCYLQPVVEVSNAD